MLNSKLKPMTLEYGSIIGRQRLIKAEANERLDFTVVCPDENMGIAGFDWQTVNNGLLQVTALFGLNQRR